MPQPHPSSLAPHSGELHGTATPISSRPSHSMAACSPCAPPPAWAKAVARVPSPLGYLRPCRKLRHVLSHTMTLVEYLLAAPWSSPLGSEPLVVSPSPLSLFTSWFACNYVYIYVRVGMYLYVCACVINICVCSNMSACVCISVCELMLCAWV